MVDDEEGLRAVVRELIDRYRQPALIEVYIPGREFTVGLLGDRRPRVLPPMEILFKDKSNQRPVYDYQIKQEWEKHVAYQCPAQLSPAELVSAVRLLLMAGYETTVNQLANVTECDETRPIEDPYQPHWTIRGCAITAGSTGGKDRRLVNVLI